MEEEEEEEEIGEEGEGEGYEYGQEGIPTVTRMWWLW